VFPAGKHHPEDKVTASGRAPTGPGSPKPDTAAGLDAFGIEEFIGQSRLKVRMGHGGGEVDCGSPIPSGPEATGLGMEGCAF
jgi:hypothetical protein